MQENDANFEYLLGIVEGSRLPHRKKMDFILMLMDETSEALAKVAAEVKKDEDSFEIMALNSISDSRAARIATGDTQFLTYDQLIIKNAMREALT